MRRLLVRAVVFMLGLYVPPAYLPPPPLSLSHTHRYSNPGQMWSATDYYGTAKNGKCAKITAFITAVHLDFQLELRSATGLLRGSDSEATAALEVSEGGVSNTLYVVVRMNQSAFPVPMTLIEAQVTLSSKNNFNAIGVIKGDSKQTLTNYNTTLNGVAAAFQIGAVDDNIKRPASALSGSFDVTIGSVVAGSTADASADTTVSTCVATYSIKESAAVIVIDDDEAEFVGCTAASRTTEAPLGDCIFTTSKSVFVAGDLLRHTIELKTAPLFEVTVLFTFDPPMPGLVADPLTLKIAEGQSPSPLDVIIKALQPGAEGAANPLVVTMTTTLQSIDADYNGLTRTELLHVYTTSITKVCGCNSEAGNENKCEAGTVATTSCPTSGGTQLTLHGVFPSIATARIFKISVGLGDCANVVREKRFAGLQGGVGDTVETSDAGANTAIFTIHNTGTGAYTFDVTTAGSGYNSAGTADTIVIKGSNLGGVDGTNDCTLTVTGAAGAAALSAANVDATGTPAALPSTTSVTCILPEGTGMTIVPAIQVNGITFLPPDARVSYGGPTVTSAEGCNPDQALPLETVECPRDKDPTPTEITIHGTNFGPGARGTVVLVNGRLCETGTTGAIDNHIVVHCALPSGTTLKAPVQVLQSGAISPAATVVSYTQCKQGWRQEGIDCVACVAGTYSTALNAARCVACEAGKFSSSDESIACELCAAGMAQPSAQQIKCDTCLAGEFQTSTGQSVCLKCEKGKFSSASAGECASCGLGTHAASKTAGGEIISMAEGAVMCQPCKTSRYTPSDKAMKCLDCAEGTYLPFASATACFACPKERTTCTGGVAVISDRSWVTSCRPGVNSLTQVANVTQCGEKLSCGDAAQHIDDGTMVYECPLLGACKTEKSTCTDESCGGTFPYVTCAEGFTGPLCASCCPDWALIGTRCEFCPTDKVFNALLAIALIAGVAIFIIVLIVTRLKSACKRMEGGQRGLASGVLRVFLNWVQTLGLLTANAAKPPATFTDLLKRVSVFTDGVSADAFPIQCMTQFGQNEKAIVSMIAPFFALLSPVVLIITTWVVLRVVVGIKSKCKKRKHVSQKEQDKERAIVREVALAEAGWEVQRKKATEKTLESTHLLLDTLRTTLIRGVGDKDSDAPDLTPLLSGPKREEFQKIFSPPVLRKIAAIEEELTGEDAANVYRQALDSLAAHRSVVVGALNRPRVRLKRGWTRLIFSSQIELIEDFMRADEDGSGGIDVDELAQLLPHGMTHEDIATVFKKFSVVEDVRIKKLFRAKSRRVSSANSFERESMYCAALNGFAGEEAADGDAEDDDAEDGDAEDGSDGGGIVLVVTLPQYIKLARSLEIQRMLILTVTGIGEYVCVRESCLALVVLLYPIGYCCCLLLLTPSLTSSSSSPK